MRDPAAIHPTGLGLTLGNCIADHATLADFPTPGITGRLAKALDTEIVYRDNATTWVAWVTPSGGGVTTPAKWVTYDAPSSSSFAAGGAHTINWNVVSADTHDDPTSESSGFITIGEDGWYSISGTVRCAGVPTTTAYTAFKRELVIFRSYTLGGDLFFSPIQDFDVKGIATLTTTTQEAWSNWSWFGYLLNGDSTNVNVTMFSAGGTAVSWQYVDGKMRIEQVPL